MLGRVPRALFMPARAVGGPSLATWIPKVFLGGLLAAHSKMPPQRKAVNKVTPLCPLQNGIFDF